MKNKSATDPTQTARLQAVVKAYAPQLIEAVSDGMILVQNGRIKAANQRIVDIYGDDLNRLIELPVVDVLPQFDRILPGIASPPADDAPTAPPSTAIATSFVPSNRKPLDVSVQAVSVGHDQQHAWLLLLRPSFGPNPIGREVQATRQLESIAALSGGIAHDFNNLLTVIIGNISLIQSYIDAGDIVYKMLEEAYEASMMAKALSQKLITFAKGGGPLKKTTALAPVIRAAGEFSLSGSNIKAEFDLAPDLHLVEIDQTQISQAIYNIITNAKEAMPQGGTVRIEASNVDFSPGNAERFTPGRHVKIEIRDQGVGIAESNLEKIFDPYFSTKERGAQKGMGLGLSICHSIVEKHNGWMRVESQTETGTAIEIFLPASDKSQVDEVSPPMPSPSHMRPGQGRILVMDDEEMIVKLAGLILERLGYQAEFARDGREAVSKYRDALNAGTPFDAVVLDLTVRGGWGGREAIREMTALDPAVKAIVSSGYSDSPVLTHYRQYGFKGVVVKPYSLAELSQVLYRVLND